MNREMKKLEVRIDRYLDKFERYRELADHYLGDEDLESYRAAKQIANSYFCAAIDCEQTWTAVKRRIEFDEPMDN